MGLEKLDTEIRQEQITEAALGLIAAHGVRRLSMAALARRVGLVPSGLYRHFRNKHEILKAAVNLIDQRAAQSVLEVCDRSPNAIERLEFLLVVIVKMIRELQAMPRIMFSEGVSGDQPEGKQLAKRVLKGLLGRIEAIVREGQEKGQVRSDIDALSLAIMFWGMIPPAVILWHMSDGKFDVTRHAEKSWKLFKESIQAR